MVQHDSHTFPDTLKPESRGQARRWQSAYHDTMIDHDKAVGQLLDAVDELGLADDTIVFYSTDNGPHMNTWPDAGMTPFRNEKNSNWEGAYRVPGDGALAGSHPCRPGAERNRESHRLVHHSAGSGRKPGHRRATASGHEMDGRSYKVHLDGFNQLAYFTGESDLSARPHFFYVSDDGDLTAMRWDNWKFVFLEQRATGKLQIWMEPYTELRVPKIFNLRTDPYERADVTSSVYFHWLLEHAWTLIPAQAYVAEMVQSLVEFPPSQTPSSFTITQVMDKLKGGYTSA